MISSIDAVIESSLDLQGPGLAVAIARAGECLQCKGYGLANLEWANPVTPDTVFRLATLTQAFTATAILLLCQDGKLKLSDTIATYLPDLPAHWHHMTLEHLLSHTSGLPNYKELDGFIRIWSRADLSPGELCILFKDLPLEFEPGTRFALTNSGYVLLGLLIEVISGMSYREFIQTSIFTPLGMEHSYYMLQGIIIPRRAAGYVRVHQGYQHAPFRSVTTSFAAGGLGATVGDLLIWDNALRTQPLLSPDMQERITTPVRLMNGECSTYGLGWFVEERAGHRVAYHPGDIEGFTTLMVRYLDTPLTLILLANLAGQKLTDIAWKISELLL